MNSQVAEDKTGGKKYIILLTEPANYAIMLSDLFQKMTAE